MTSQSSRRASTWRCASKETKQRLLVLRCITWSSGAREPSRAPSPIRSPPQTRRSAVGVPYSAARPERRGTSSFHHISTCYLESADGEPRDRGRRFQPDPLSGTAGNVLLCLLLVLKTSRSLRHARVADQIQSETPFQMRKEMPRIDWWMSRRPGWRGRFLRPTGKS